MLRGMSGLLADFRIDHGRCMPLLDMGVLGIIQELVIAAPELGITDRAMIAYALSDPDSASPISRDSMVVGNSAIDLYEKAARARGLRNTALDIVNPAETCPSF